MRSWLKGGLLLAALAAVSVLAILLPEAELASRTVAPVSIFPTSHDPTVLAIPSRPIEKLSEPQRTRYSAFSVRASVKNAPVSLSVCRYTVHSPYQSLGTVSNFNAIFRRAFQQACLFLDVPPPPAVTA